MARLLFAAALLLTAACGRRPAPVDAPPTEEAPVEETAAIPWLVRVTTPTPLLQPDTATGCLTPGATRFEADTELQVLAASADFVLVNDAGGIVSARDVAEVSKPQTLPPGRAGLIGYTGNKTPSASYGADGCPVEGEPLDDGTPVEAFARSHDANYRGWVVIDRALKLAPVRQVEVPGWVYPWHTGLQLIRPLETGGFVMGAAVLIGPYTLLTAKHMGVDEKTCYGRELITGPAWYGGRFVCDNIAGPEIPAPLGVDAAIVQLVRPEGGPYARLRGLPVQPGEAFFTSRWSRLSRNVFADGKVISVGNMNALCEDWPANTAFNSEPIVSGGDSGGPAWVGDELVGLAHGGQCRGGFDPPDERHVFVHVPGILSFLVPELPPEE